MNADAFPSTKIQPEGPLSSINTGYIVKENMSTTHRRHRSPVADSMVDTSSNQQHYNSLSVLNYRLTMIFRPFPGLLRSVSVPALDQPVPPCCA